jgi:hypothetical protein
MSKTTKFSEPRQAEVPALRREHEQGLPAGVVGLVLGIILTSIVIGAVLLAGADRTSPGLFSPERSRTEVPAWMRENPETFSPERSRTQVPAWMRQTPEIFSPERSRTQVSAWMRQTPEIFSPERSRTQVSAWMRETR